jgi:hypothetical protein
MPGLSLSIAGGSEAGPAKSGGKIPDSPDNTLQLERATGGPAAPGVGLLVTAPRRRAPPAGEDRTMHETRNFILVLLVLGSLVWAFFALFVLDPNAVPFILAQRIASILIFVCTGLWLIYALKFEDKIPNHMREHVGEIYYGADGLIFMPALRNTSGQAELCVYYQNRYENPVQAIVHLKPPEDSFIVRPGVRDVHFAFKSGGGDFGVIRQPVAVPEHLQGEVIEIELAAASFYPRGRGSRLLKQIGLPCGSLQVDWGGSAFKSGVHEVSGEVELEHPIRLHLAMPTGVNAFATGDESWRQECIVAGTKD